MDYAWGTGLVPIMPVILLAVAMTLLPVVGVTMVWLPIALLFWSSDHRMAAIAVGFGSLIVHGAINMRITASESTSTPSAMTGWVFYYF